MKASHLFLLLTLFYGPSLCPQKGFLRIQFWVWGSRYSGAREKELTGPGISKRHYPRDPRDHQRFQKGNNGDLKAESAREKKDPENRVPHKKDPLSKILHAGQLEREPPARHSDSSCLVEHVNQKHVLPFQSKQYYGIPMGTAGPLGIPKRE